MFQCITDFNHRVQGIYGPQFGSHNDKGVVKHDGNLCAIRLNWLFKNAKWKYYNADGNKRL